MSNDLHFISSRPWMAKQLTRASRVYSHANRLKQRRPRGAELTNVVHLGVLPDPHVCLREVEDKRLWTVLVANEINDADEMRKHLVSSIKYLERNLASKIERYKKADEDCARRWFDVASLNRSAELFREADASEPKVPSVRPISSINVGTTSYRFRNVEQATISSFADGHTRVEVSGLSPTFFGVGSSLKEAWQNFTNTVHSRFQLLSRLRPFQMEVAELRDWNILEGHIDTADYWSKTPLKMIETGLVEEIDSQGMRDIRWLDGTEEKIPVSKLPAEFAALKKGQWFEAIIERLTGHYELSEIKFVQSINAPHIMNDLELQEWMKKLPNAALPPAETSWDAL